MKLQFNKQVIPHGVIIVVVAVGLCLTRDWHYETSLFPRAAGITAIVVALIAMVMEMRPKEGQAAEAKALWALPSRNRRRAAGDFLILAGFLLGIWLLGYVPAAMLFLFLYVRFRGRQAWLTAILVTVGAFLFMQLIFGMLLDIKWFPGVLIKMLDL